MRTAIIISAIALVNGVCGFVFPGQIPATPAGVFRRADTGGLYKRQETCDDVSGLSCRAGEYCVVIDGSIGCCPEGKVCGSIRTCVDHDTPGCHKGGTIDGALCCDASVPYCNTAGNTQFCDAVKLETTTSVTSTTTICAHTNATATVTPTSPSHPAGNATTTYVLPTLTPYPTVEKPKVTSTTELPTTLLMGQTSSYYMPTPNVTSTVPVPSLPAQEGDAVASGVSFGIIFGGIAIAFAGIFMV